MMVKKISMIVPRLPSIGPNSMNNTISIKGRNINEKAIIFFIFIYSNHTLSHVDKISSLVNIV